MPPTTPAGFAYSALTEDDRRAMINDRLRALEADHFGHELALAALAGVDDEDETKAPAVAHATESAAVIERAHKALTAELAKLPKPKADK